METFLGMQLTFANIVIAWLLCGIVGIILNIPILLFYDKTDVKLRDVFHPIVMLGPIFAGCIIVFFIMDVYDDNQNKVIFKVKFKEPKSVNPNNGQGLLEKKKTEMIEKTKNNDQKFIGEGYPSMADSDI